MVTGVDSRSLRQTIVVAAATSTPAAPVGSSVQNLHGGLSRARWRQDSRLHHTELKLFEDLGPTNHSGVMAIALCGFSPCSVYGVNESSA